MAAISRSSVMTVSARKMLEKQVVLMIGKRLCTVRNAGGGERGLTEKTWAWGGICAHKTEWTLRRERGYKSKMWKKNQEKLQF